MTRGEEGVEILCGEPATAALHAKAWKATGKFCDGVEYTVANYCSNHLPFLMRWRVSAYIVTLQAREETEIVVATPLHSHASPFFIQWNIFVFILSSVYVGFNQILLNQTGKINTCKKKKRI